MATAHGESKSIPRKVFDGRRRCVGVKERKVAKHHTTQAGHAVDPPYKKRGPDIVTNAKVEQSVTMHTKALFGVPVDLLHMEISAEEHDASDEVVRKLRNLEKVMTLT